MPLSNQNNYIKQLFYFFEGANIQHFILPTTFFYSLLKRVNLYACYQLDLVRPGINPNTTISRKVTRLTPKSRM